MPERKVGIAHVIRYYDLVLELGSIDAWRSSIVRKPLVDLALFAIGIPIFAMWRGWPSVRDQWIAFIAFCFIPILLAAIGSILVSWIVAPCRLHLAQLSALQGSRTTAKRSEVYECMVAANRLHRAIRPHSRASFFVGRPKDAAFQEWLRKLKSISSQLPSGLLGPLPDLIAKLSDENLGIVSLRTELERTEEWLIHVYAELGGDPNAASE